MTTIARHMNTRDTARTGVIAFLDANGRTLTIEPCWLPQQGAGFIRFTVDHSGGYHWSGVYDYAEFEGMVLAALETRRSANA